MSHPLSRALLVWYAKHHRKLPWRKTADPYKIWVSEIMLQQTQVRTVVDYYNRWILKFPTLQALAKAQEHTVLKAWQGLGYYRRAKNLHKAAREIVAQYRGKFPKDLEAIRTLPGVGAYTAGAIASIAFNKKISALDVNVLRVASRILKVQEDPSQAAIRARIETETTRWIPPGKARWFNQALMELGALICLPSQPHCLLCPVRQFCGAFREGLQEKIPPRRATGKKIKLTVVAGILQDAQGRVLIQKRPEGGLMGNLWEFPGGKVESKEDLREALVREWREELGVSICPQAECMVIRHAYTQFNVELHVWTCRLAAGRPRALWAQEFRWAPVQDLDDFAYPSANAKIVRWLQQKEREQIFLEKAPATR